MVYNFRDNSPINIQLFDENLNEITTNVHIHGYSISYTAQTPINAELKYTIAATDLSGNKTEVPISFSTKLFTPITIATYPSGEYKDEFKVHLVTSDSNAIIYYTTDGTKPIVGGVTTLFKKAYVQDIVINTTTNLQFFAIDSIGTKEEIKSVVYRFDEIETFDTAINATFLDNNKIKLSWTSNLDAVEYKVYKTSSKIEKEVLEESRFKKYWTPKKYLLASTNTNSFSDLKIELGSNYYYGVSMIDSNGIESTISDLVSIQTIPSVAISDLNDGIIRAKNYLLTVQNDDGSWGTNESKMLYTSSVLDALHLYKDNNIYAVNKALEFLISNNTDNNDYLSRKIYTLHRYNHYVQHLLAKLTSEARFNTVDGKQELIGWGLSKEYNQNALESVLAHKTMALFPDLFYEYIIDINNNYRLMQNNNNHWGWSQENNIDSIYISSMIYNMKNDSEDDFTWIQNLQDTTNNSFNSSILDTSSAITNLNLETSATIKAKEYLYLNQLTDGSINNDPYLTALVLQALLKGVE